MSKRICLWATPRNISTALMYSFAQRPDTLVIDEPLYGFYLKHSGVLHPGKEEVLKNMETDGQKVIKNIILKTYNQPVIFLKQMTHHLLDLDLAFLEQTINVLLIRNPYEMILSYTKVISHPTMETLGLKAQYELFNYLQSVNALHAIIDSKYLLMNPKEVLEKLCDKIGIPFFEEMLRWKAGARPEDGVWAQYWYDSVHNSTGYKPYMKVTEHIPEYLSGLYKACSPYYDQLTKHAIR